MTFPEEIFPVDKTDPTAGTKEQEYHVERTLGVIGHVRTVTKKRHWRYLAIDPINCGGNAASHIRDFYKLPNAPVAHQNGTWAVWAGEGEPTSEAFETAEPIEPVADRAEIVRAASRAPFNSGLVHGSFPDEETLETRGTGQTDPVLAEIAKQAPPGTVLSSPKASQEPDFQDAWAYSTKNVNSCETKEGYYDAMRVRYATRPDAPIEVNQAGDVSAIWLGKGAPTRPAFPHQNGGSPLEPYRIKPEPETPLPQVKVSPHVPSAALNEMGLKLYGMSRETVFSDSLRNYLLKVSDSLHAEASRIELSKVRGRYDRKP